MRKHRVLFKLLAIGFLGFLMGFIPLKGTDPAETKLEQYLEIEFKRLEETYSLLDQFAEKIWPGWNNYNDIEFNVRFPNNVHVLVNPRGAVPEGYVAVQGRTVRGKSIYLNRKEELPIELTPPLTGGGGGGLSIRIRMRESKLSPEDLEILKNLPADKQPPANSERQVLIYVHEFFHGFQAGSEVLEKEGEDLYNFKVNIPYAVYSNIEGLALWEAYANKDQNKALEALQEYQAARDIKEKAMPPAAVPIEKMVRFSEGTASYSNIKMAMLIRDSQYKPCLNREIDPFFFDYKYLDPYIKETLEEDAKDCMGETLDKIGKGYSYGALQCFVLDRFVPDWKQGFFQGKKKQDQAIDAFLQSTPRQKEAAAQRLNTKYPFKEIYAKHEAAIKERDDAIALIKNRKGKKYIVDFIKIKELPGVKPRGKAVLIDVERIFPHGIEKLYVGEVELTSLDTPMYCPLLYAYEWVDTEPVKDKKGFEVTFKEKADETYKNLVFKTGGFTLKAPEAQITEDNEKNEVRVRILCKVSR